jgi:hypothetical protein
VPLGLMLPHGGCKLQTREELQHLRENATYSIQGGGLPSVEIAFAKLTSIDSAIEILDGAYEPESTREELAEAVGSALDILRGEESDEDEEI